MAVLKTVREHVHYPAVLLVPVTLAFLVAAVLFFERKLIILAILVNMMAAIITIAPTLSRVRSKRVIPVVVALLMFVIGVLLLWPMERVLSMVVGVFFISMGLFSVSLAIDAGQYRVHINAAASLFCAVLTLVLVITQGGLLGIIAFGLITVLFVGDTVRMHYN